MCDALSPRLAGVGRGLATLIPPHTKYKYPHLTHATEFLASVYLPDTRIGYCHGQPYLPAAHL